MSRIERTDAVTPIEQEEFSSPQISVVVRARNEANNILLALESLRKQTLQSFETVVVDNDSDDGTTESVSCYLRETGFSGKLVREERIGRGVALHTGVIAAKSEWIACLDADSIATPNWLETIVSFIQENPNYVAGSGQIFFKDGPSHHKILYKWGKRKIYSLASRHNQGWISLANSWFKKSTFFSRRWNRTLSI